MDVKNIFDEYYQIVNIKNVDISKIKQSINECIQKESSLEKGNRIKEVLY